MKLGGQNSTQKISRNGMATILDRKTVNRKELDKSASMPRDVLKGNGNGFNLQQTENRGAAMMGRTERSQRTITKMSDEVWTTSNQLTPKAGDKRNGIRRSRGTQLTKANPASMEKLSRGGTVAQKRCRKWGTGGKKFKRKRESGVLKATGVKK